MADVFALAEVRLWGMTVGAVAEGDDGRIIFQYDPEFRRSGREISPRMLPLRTSSPVAFDELRRKKAFQGLPGVLADALPDSFGYQVIRAYYTTRGEERRAFSPVQHLLYVGERAMGALSFHPAEAVEGVGPEQDALDVARLVADARSIAAGGSAEIAVPEIYRIGSSAGGMRPKAIVLHNPTSGEVRSAFATPRPGDIPAILKFDGVGEDAQEGQMGGPEHYNRVEAAYALMARDAGMDIVEINILESEEGHAHLLIPRFDFSPDVRLHQHTFGGYAHVDYNDSGASSYEEYLRAILALGMSQASVVEGFRRMVFNVFGVNQDDHVKNLSFHMNRSGDWSLTPAYDVTFAAGSEFTARHQMRIGHKQEGFGEVTSWPWPRAFSIKSPARIVDQVEGAVAGWPRYAESTGVPRFAIDNIGRRLRERRNELRGKSV